MGFPSIYSGGLLFVSSRTKWINKKHFLTLFKLPAMKKLFFLISCSAFFFCSYSYAQQYEVIQGSYQLKVVADPGQAKDSWNAQVLNLDNPYEGNKAYAEHIQQIKQEVEKRFPRKQYPGFKEQNVLNVDTPMVISGFEGNPFYNSVPNDNSLAVSNDGMLMSAINTSIYFFDTNNDTLLKTVQLSTFSDTLGLVTDQYDPKLLYDPDADKFIIVYLAGFLDSTSNVIVGFSQSNDPLGLWNLYYLPGNPISDTSWSDFPAIAMTENELFITVNLLKNNESWQNAFKQSVVWQVDKNSGYTGDTLSSKLWYNILYDGKSMRNLNPIGGGSQLYGPDIYFLSDRNFDVQNDTIFLLHLSNVISDSSATMTVTPVIADKAYGMPPKARQPSGHTFETNDARVLAGFFENNVIQFVGNTIDTLTGNAAFFHGIMSNLLGSPSLHLEIISDTVDFGYPNISYTGTSSFDYSAIITVNHSSPTTPAGFSAYFYNGSGSYSPRIFLKKGNTFVNLLSGSYERWGDYSGSQRKYDEPGKVWVAGSFGKLHQVGVVTYHEHGTWIAQLEKPAENASLGEFSSVGSGLLVYPNPSNDIMYINFDMPDDANVEVTIYDLSGKRIRQLLSGHVESGDNLLTFDSHLLSRGTYVITIKDQDNIFLTQKIVKE
jgi:hypothetical protein